MKKRIIVALMCCLVALLSSCAPITHKNNPFSAKAFQEKAFHSKEYAERRGDWKSIFSDVLILFNTDASCDLRRYVSGDISPTYLWVILEDDDPAIEQFLSYLELCRKAFPNDFTAKEKATAPAEEINSHLLVFQKGTHDTLLSQIWLYSIAPECFPKWNKYPNEFATEERLREIIAAQN